MGAWQSRAPTCSSQIQGTRVKSKPKTRRLSNSSQSALPPKAAPEYSIPHPDTMPDRYVVHCAGNCMEPDIADGAPVLVEKHGKIAPGDLVVLFFKPDHVPAGKHLAILKRLVMAPPHYVSFPWREHPKSEVHALIIVEMLNPRKKFAYECEHLLGVHKCLGPVPAGMILDVKGQTYQTHAGETILSDARTPGDLSENAGTIPAVDSSADGRSAGNGEVTDPSPIAPPARTSRRGFLMNSMVSAVSIASATALASTDASPKAAAEIHDPIFAAIEAHRQANAAYLEATTKCAEMDDTALPHARVCVGYTDRGQFLASADDLPITWADNGKLPIYHGGVHTLTWKSDGELTPIYVNTPGDIERNAPSALSGAVRGAWIAERCLELTTEEKRINDEYAQSQVAKASAIQDVAYEVKRDRMWDLIWTAPTTLPGLATALAYFRDESDIYLDEEWQAALSWSIECAVRSFAGLPMPPMSATVAELWNDQMEEGAGARLTR
jgi:hypothetical protein